MQLVTQLIAEYEAELLKRRRKGTLIEYPDDEGQQ